MHVCDPEAPKHQSMLNQKQLKPPRSRQQMEISILMCTCVHGKSLNFYAYPAHDCAGRDGGTMSRSGSLLENEGTKGILLMQDAWSLISSFVTSWYHHSSHTIDREQKAEYLTGHSSCQQLCLAAGREVTAQFQEAGGRCWPAQFHTAAAQTDRADLEFCLTLEFVLKYRIMLQGDN